MGLLSEGSPLSWQQTKALADHVRKHGIIQFINLYHSLKDRTDDCLRWGDEVEYMLVKFDHENKKVRLFLDADRLLRILQETERTKPGDNPTSWKPEYAAYMIEGTPGRPYGHRMAHFNMVEANMKLRREEVLCQLPDAGSTALSLTAFPKLGCPDFCEPAHLPTPTSGASRSLFFPEEAIFQGHPRFSTLTRNIRQRRGEKVAINIPIFKDKKTPSPFIEDFSRLGDDGEAQKASKPDHIYMDCMGYGMGCSCLQMTFQAVNINEARVLYDQLNPLCPILLALSAASPIHRGYLADIDCRWDIISASVDCRTAEERGEKPLKSDRFVIPKSRFASISNYLSPCGSRYNDVDLVLDTAVYNKLRENDIDHLLAQHIAHLFIRDPISLFNEKVDQNDEEDTDHFENIQSTNWQTMRFKPPPPNSPIGWRVEFRPTEVQLTDFENAAFVVFIALLTRVILSYRLNLIIPISKVDDNMKKAHKRDAVLNEKFHFRKDVITCNSPVEAEVVCGCTAKEIEENCCPMDDEYTLLNINEIINGKEGEFIGLVPLVRRYLESIDDCDVDTSCTIKQYLSFIQKRASGELMTTARWMRDFVSKHPSYQQDSVVTDEISYDLIQTCEQLTSGKLTCPQLLPTYNTKSTGTIPTAMAKEEVYLECRSRCSKGSASTRSQCANTSL